MHDSALGDFIAELLQSVQELEKQRSVSQQQEELQAQLDQAQKKLKQDQEQLKKDQEQLKNFQAFIVKMSKQIEELEKIEAARQVQHKPHLKLGSGNK